MARFSKRSRANLDGCHDDIIAVCNELIIVTDFSVVFGNRPPELQFELYQKGREFKNDKWIVARQNEVVTYCDGFKKLSNHNKTPSDAVDLIPYPSKYSDRNEQYYLAGAFLAVAYRLKVQGIIESSFRWGGRWKSFKDYPHFERVKAKGN